MAHSYRKVLVAAFVALVGSQARGDPYPTRPITIVVAYKPGGTNDIIARTVAGKLSEIVGQPVIVENKPGAGGNIGAAFVARAAPDGYTILNAPISLLAINQWLYGNLQYDPEKDFAPVTLVGSVPNMLITNASVPVSDAKGLIEYARKNGGKLFYASMGSGTTGHLSGELFKLMAGVEMTHVPYKGSAPALQDLLGGRVHLMFDNLPTALPLARDGKVKAVALTSMERHPLVPDVPTLDESGLKGFEAAPWFGFVAPAATPKAIVQRLNEAIVKALGDPAVSAALTKLGLTLVGNRPEQFAAFIAAESKKWREVVEKSGAKPD